MGTKICSSMFRAGTLFASTTPETYRANGKESNCDLKNWGVGREKTKKKTWKWLGSVVKKIREVGGSSKSPKTVYKAALWSEATLIQLCPKKRCGRAMKRKKGVYTQSWIRNPLEWNFSYYVLNELCWEVSNFTSRSEQAKEDESTRRQNHESNLSYTQSKRPNNISAAGRAEATMKVSLKKNIGKKRMPLMR